MYYDIEGDYYILYDHDIYFNIPFTGWLHNCMFCKTITSNTCNFEHKDFLIKVICCYECKNLKK